jgi:hypothetical protein
VDLCDNFLTGTLPTEIGAWTRLTNVNSARNRMQGEIPSEIRRLEQLNKLTLHDNILTGAICDNFLTGTLPTEIGAWTRLTNVNGARNRIQGEIPSEIGRLEQLNKLTLHDNILTGAIPTEIGGLTNLATLSAFITASESDLGVSSKSSTSRPISTSWSESMVNIIGTWSPGLTVLFRKLCCFNAVVIAGLRPMTDGIPVVEDRGLKSVPELPLTFSFFPDLGGGGLRPTNSGKLVLLSSSCRSFIPERTASSVIESLLLSTRDTIDHTPSNFCCEGVVLGVSTLRRESGRIGLTPIPCIFNFRKDGAESISKGNRWGSIRCMVVVDAGSCTPSC